MAQASVIFNSSEDVRFNVSLSERFRINGSGVDMHSNSMYDFFETTSCTDGEVVDRIRPDGSYVCTSLTGEITDQWVNTSGDVMTGNLNMSGNNINSLSSLLFAGNISIGNNHTVARDKEALSIGVNATSADDSIAIGTRAEALGEGNKGNSIAIGEDASVTRRLGIAIGARTAAGGRGIALGEETTANKYAVAIGQGAGTDGESQIAIGRCTGSDVSSWCQSNSGPNTMGTASIALGYKANAPNDYTMNIGSLADYRYNLNVTGNATVHGRGGMYLLNGDLDVEGNKIVYATDSGLAIGQSTSIGNSDSIAIGTSASADNYGVTVGRNSQAGNSGAAIGDDAQTVARGTAVGAGANADSDKSIAIGACAGSTSGFCDDASIGKGAVAIGWKARSPNDWEATFGNLNQYQMNLNATGNTTIHGDGGLTMKNGDIQMSDNSVSNAKEYDLGNGMKLTKKGDTLILSD